MIAMGAVELFHKILCTIHNTLSNSYLYYTSDPLRAMGQFYSWPADVHSVTSLNKGTSHTEGKHRVLFHRMTPTTYLLKLHSQADNTFYRSPLSSQNFGQKAKSNHR